jgi:holliday junction DNA helicase RuvA
MNDFSHGSTRTTHQPVWREQLTSALVSLGFSAKDSDDAINTVLSDVSQEEIARMELGELLKLALQSGKK